MRQLRELMIGDGSLDTAFRAMAMAVFLAVATALIWTTLTVRKDARAADSVSVHNQAILINPRSERERLLDSFLNESPTTQAVVIIRKEHKQ